MENLINEVESEINKTTVVILAGGLGKRINTNTPKPLLKLKEDYTLLDNEIDFYYRCGFRNFAFLLGYGAEEIISHLERKEYKRKIKYRISVDPTTKNWGKGKAVKCAFEKGILKRERIIISYPDDIKLDRYLPIKLLLTHLDAKEKFDIIGTIVLTLGYEFPFGVAKVKNNFVTEFTEKPLMDVLVSIGMYVFEKEFLDIVDSEIDLNEEKAIEFEERILPKIAREGKLYSLFVSHNIWIPVNDMKSYEKAIKVINEVRV